MSSIIYARYETPQQAHPQDAIVVLPASAMKILSSARLSMSVPTRSSRNWPSALAMYSSTISRWCGSVMECATATLPSEMRATWSASGASWSSCAANACRTTATLSVAPTSARPVHLIRLQAPLTTQQGKLGGSCWQVERFCDSYQRQGRNHYSLAANTGSPSALVAHTSSDQVSMNCSTSVALLSMQRYLQTCEVGHKRAGQRGGSPPGALRQLQQQRRGRGEAQRLRHGRLRCCRKGHTESCDRVCFATS